MFVHSHRVSWSEVDAAGLVFFPRFLEYCHHAIEAMFDALPGGYAHLTIERRIGVPTVHLEVDFRAPLRFGDTCDVQLTVEKLGRSSVTFRHRLVRSAAAVTAAEVTQVVVVTDLASTKSIAMPEDVRRVLTAHLSAVG